MSGGSIGACVEGSEPLVVGGVCGVLFSASGMRCMWSIPGALYTQTSWPLFYLGKVFILHYLQRNAYLISRWERVTVQMPI